MTVEHGKVYNLGPRNNVGVPVFIVAGSGNMTQEQAQLLAEALAGDVVKNPASFKPSPPVNPITTE